MSTATQPRPLTVSKRHPRLRLRRPLLTRVIATLDAQASRFNGGCPKGELSLVFLTDSGLAGLHDTFLDDPSTTDVITFEGAPSFGVAGEICVSVDTALAYAKKHRRPFSEELTLYVVHGWLHLAGYDDLRPDLKRAMRRAEARALRLLGDEDLLGAFTIAAP